MVVLKSWKDNYVFLRDFCNCSCLNCHYGGAEYTDDSEDHTDSEYAHLFCRNFISMVRLDLQFVCAGWKHKDNGKSLEEYSEEDMWNLTDEVIDILDKDDRRWSIDEIKGLIKDECK